MPIDCDPFFDDRVEPLRRRSNRAALSRIDYRIGRYPDFVDYLFHQINHAQPLQAWTHRLSDDPGIALLEGAAIVGDVLTFYQEHYANEAFLRTASWRESVEDLTRLSGYRLAPGLAGRTTFALDVKANTSVTVPAGFPIKAELEFQDEPVEFKTSHDLDAEGYLSNFNLYRRRYYSTSIPANTTRLELDSIDGDQATAALAQLDLQAGDKLMLVPAEPAWTSGGSDMDATQDDAQVLAIKSIEQVLDRTIIEFETPLAHSWSADIQAYRIGRRFRHFGHNAPASYTSNTTDVNDSNKIDGAIEHATAYDRDIDTGHDCGLTSLSINLPPELIPLDSQVDDLLVNSRVIVETDTHQGGLGDTRHLVCVRDIARNRVASLSFAALTGPTSLITLDRALIQFNAPFIARSDVRDYQLHEVTSARIGLRKLATHANGSIFGSTNILHYFGSAEQAQRLSNRRLLLVHEAGHQVDLHCVTPADDFELPPGSIEQDRMWPLSFDQQLPDFFYRDFSETEPVVSVFGNLVDADQGKLEKEAVLGNGDSRIAFQTFKLPKAPLTYRLSSSTSPPYTPELEVFVNRQLWTRVDSLFGQAADAQVYIVREDADGNSYVQFGNNITGARLPPGIKNVTALFCSGSGAYGNLKPGTSPNTGLRLAGLDKAHLHSLVTSGAVRESSDVARRAAPGRVQGLGRIVSLADYETELLTIPGVTSARASWDLLDSVAAVRLLVLLDNGRESEMDSIRDTIYHFQRCRGSNRFALVVEQALLQFSFVSISYSADPALRSSDIEASIQRVLGLSDYPDDAYSGLFGLYQRRLGDAEYASRIEGTVQQIEGIQWCRVTGLGLFADDIVDPLTVSLPASPLPLAARLHCEPTRLLQLHSSHLQLVSAPPLLEGDCA